MGNTTVKWMTLYRQERKAHQAEIDRLTQEYEAKLLQEQQKNKWLNDKMIDVQKKNRILTFEIARKEGQISDLQQLLRRAQKLGRGFKKKTLVETSVSSSNR